MLEPCTQVDETTPAPFGAGQDYERVAAAIRYLDARRHERPSLDAVAAQVELSPHHFQRMFRRWCGVTPKQFLSYLPSRIIR